MRIHPLSTVILAAACTLPSALFAQTGDSSSSTSALSSQAKAGATVPPAQVFAKLLSGEEKEIVDAAGAMPPDKFNFAPGKAMGTFDGVRTFSSQVKHLTEANYGFFHGFGVAGGKSRADIEKLTGRDEILQALKDSYTYAHAAIATITAENAFLDMDGKGTTRAGMAAYSLEHNNDHYGQMVEYLRMNGTIPPASRR